MSAIERSRGSLAGLTLDAVLGGENQETPPAPPPLPLPLAWPPGRTLLDIIKEDKELRREKKNWKTFRDKLRLKRTGSAWTSSVPIPASDIPIQFPNNHHNNNNVDENRSVSWHGSHQSKSVREPDGSTETIQASPNPPAPTSTRPVFSRGSSIRFANHTDHDDSPDSSMPGDGFPSRSFKPQMSRHSSIRLPQSNLEAAESDDENGDAAAQNGTHHPVKERTLSAREAVVAQEAAEAEAAAATEEAAAAAPQPEPVRMSLMDLLEESDRQMGLAGSRYTMGDEDDDDDDDDDGDDEDDNEEDDDEGSEEFNCCICMVKTKGSAVAACGHCFCRMCSRELSVQKGNCPVCNAFILEILDVF